MKESVFESFRKLKLQTSLIGLEKTDGEDYFCVPIGAKIFAALGVDGVSFALLTDSVKWFFQLFPMP